MSTGRTDIGFDSPFISKLNYLINEDFNNEFNGEVKINLLMDTKKINQKKEEDVYLFLSTLTLKVGEKSDSFPFYCELEIRANFYRSELSEMEEEDFAKRSTAAILYSYARPIISDIITRSGFPPYNLPYMDFTNVDLDHNEIN